MVESTASADDERSTWLNHRLKHKYFSDHMGCKWCNEELDTLVRAWGSRVSESDNIKRYRAKQLREPPHRGEPDT